MKGRVGNITFYKRKDGYMAREKRALMQTVFQMTQPLPVPVRMVRSLAGQDKQGNYCVLPYVPYYLTQQTAVCLHD